MFPPPCRDITSGCLFHSVLSQCIHAVAALLYPFTWAHTYIPVVPECLLDTVCCPTPFMVGIQMRHLERVLEQPMEEVFHLEGRAAGWSHQLICVCRFGLALGPEALIVPFSHPGRLEIRVSSMLAPGAIPPHSPGISCGSRSWCWVIPVLKQRKACGDKPPNLQQKLSLWEMPWSPCPGPSCREGLIALLPPSWAGDTPVPSQNGWQEAQVPWQG